MTTRQVAKPQISDANANEVFDAITNGFEHTANLAIDSLSQDNAQPDGRVVLFFYFEDADTGLLMLILGIRGQMEVARFHLKGGLPDPRWN